MPQIEIHMFEVQLGAALLLQLEDSSGEPVTILADAGVNAAAYSQDHVAKKLVAMPRFAPGPNAKPIDLIIGTHYDQDHLAGLIDVADQLTLREAILPPVRKPRHGAANASKAAQLESQDFEDANDPPRMIELTDAEFEEHIRELDRIAEDAEAELKKLGFSKVVPEDPEADVLAPDQEFDLDTTAVPLSQAPPGLVIAQLSRIIASAHKGAIVATWLHKLVKKLKGKSVPIRALDIAAGSPEYFVWDNGTAKFISKSSTAYSSSVEPKFTLLGPSRQLIAHHAKKLPIGAYLATHQKIPLKPVTASNQLSYVMLFELAGQKIIVTGDAGCVDFWDQKAKQYHPALINGLNDLQVAQVAHHAGNNHRFYDVLEKSGFAGGSIPLSYLLLSHADQDKFRPSPAFARFISNVSSGSGSFEILTTSQPDPAKVATYRAYYHSATQSPAQSVGDVQLSYQHGAWTVDQHLVQV